MKTREGYNTKYLSIVLVSITCYSNMTKQIGSIGRDVPWTFLCQNSQGNWHMPRRYLEEYL